MKPIIICLLALGLYHQQVYAQVNIKESVFFDSDKCQIKENEIEKLEKLKQSISGKNIDKITIVGHADGNGSLAYNEELSKKRAQVIVDYLVKGGIDKSLISYQYKGEVKPMANNTLPIGRQLNRRTEIIVNFQNSLSAENFNGNTSFFKISNKRDTILTLNNRGTKIYIPQNIFEDKDGKPVINDIEIKYVAYDNSADMVFSGINMNYQQNGVSYCFNSSGMFEIKGFFNNQEISIKEGKKMQIDYSLSKQNADINFYRLNSDNKNWTMVQIIPVLASTTDNNTKDQKQNSVLKGNEAKSSMFKGDFAVDGSGFSNWEEVENLLNDNLGGITSNRKSSTLLGETTAKLDPGHTYPDIIKGLNVEKFGVYNCDQIYRLKQPLNITAKYVDEKGEHISDGNVLSLIDLNYNGAFSFSPHNFVCSAVANNVLALFTEDGELFLLEKGEFAKMNIKSEGSYTFKMKNVTKEIRSSKDLSKYLGI